MAHPVLFVCPESNYLKLNADCYGKYRNALNFPGRKVAIYHPPCADWSRLRGLSTFHPGRKWLALWSLIMVRRYGGVLEHPVGSRLFSDYIIKPGHGIDEFGGFTVCLNMSWFGYSAVKPTFIYVVGLSPGELPIYPISFDALTKVVGSGSSKNKLPVMSKKDRSVSPISFCSYLLSVCDAIISRKVEL